MTPFQRDYPTKKYRHFLIAQKSFIISNLGKYALFCRENRCVTSQTYSIMAIDKRIVISFVLPVIQHGRHESLGNGCKPPIGKVQEHRLTKNRRFGKLQLQCFLYIVKTLECKKMVTSFIQKSTTQSSGHLKQNPINSPVQIPSNPS